MSIEIKRAYEPPSLSDGERVLVDRLWPRGVKKDGARIDVWLKDLAPSHALRRWFHDRPKYFAVFRKRYLNEIASPAASQALEQLYEIARNNQTVTLVYAAKDEAHNTARPVAGHAQAAIELRSGTSGGSAGTGTHAARIGIVLTSAAPSHFGESYEFIANPRA